MQFPSYNSADKKNGFTTASERQNGSWLTFFLSAAGAKSFTTQKADDFTTTSEEQNEHSYSFFLGTIEKKSLTITDGFTTASEAHDESLLSSSPNAAGEKPKSFSKSFGFTLVEAVIAVSILLLVISGIMNVVHQGSSTTRYQKDRITATYLASDAIESIRDQRDSHWLASESEQNPNTFQNWATSSFPANCDGGSWCQVDTRQSAETVTVCGNSADDCDLLDYNTDTGLYGYETGVNWQESIFTRSFTVDTVDLDGTESGPEAIAVTMEVFWPRRTGDISSVSFTQFLYAWRY